MDSIMKRLTGLLDNSYKNFQGSLIPTIDEKSVLGIRTPELRKLAKELKGSEEAALFMQELPHNYFDENQLHAFLITEIKDYDECMEAVEKFLPYIDNWATCDQMNAKAIGKKKDRLYANILKWLESSHTYTVRFAIKCLMDYYLDDASFDASQLELAALTAHKSEEYYIRMMVAWYYATALCKHYDTTIKFIEERRLDEWTHRKAIQKARESFRITDEQKEYLKSLK